MGCPLRQQPPTTAWLNITDDIGRKVSLDNPPQRIISLAPSITEMLFAIDSGAALVGVTDYCNYPPAAKRITSVGGMIVPNFERIAALQPDLILVTVEGNSKEDFIKLESLGYKIFVTNPRTIDDIYLSFAYFGKILRKDTTTAKLIQKLKVREQHIRQKVMKEKNPKVFTIISLKPLMTAGPSTFIHQLLVKAGSKNIAEKAAVPYPILNREEIIHQQPDFLIVTNEAAPSVQTLLKEFPEWKDLHAIQNGKVLIIDGDLLSRPGPRIIDGLEILARVFHPHEFRNPDRVGTPAPRKG